MGVGGRLIGGLLAGVGTSLVEQAKADRDKALRQLEMDSMERRQTKELDAADARQSEQQSFQRSENNMARSERRVEASQASYEKTKSDQRRMDFDRGQNQLNRDSEEQRARDTRDANKNMFDKFESDETGEMVGYSKGGKVWKTGIKNVPKDLSVGERAAITLAGTTFVSKDPVEGTKVDRAGMGQFLMDTGKKIGSKSLFSMGESMLGSEGGDPSITTASGPNPPGSAKAAEPKPASIPEPKSMQEYDALPIGATYKDPAGNIRTKGAGTK